MRLTKQFCKGQIERMEGLPYYATIGANGFTELVNALATSAASENIAKAAVDEILADTSRAGSPDTNRVPSPGELRVWVRSQSPPPLDDQRPATTYCGQFAEGLTYLSHDPRTPVTDDEAELRVDIPKFLLPSKCVNGWIHFTRWLSVVPAMIYEDGSPVRQNYEYSARCACQSQPTEAAR